MDCTRCRLTKGAVERWYVGNTTHLKGGLASGPGWLIGVVRQKDAVCLIGMESCYHRAPLRRWVGWQRGHPAKSRIQPYRTPKCRVGLNSVVITCHRLSSTDSETLVCDRAHSTVSQPFTFCSTTRWALSCQCSPPVRTGV